MRRDSAEYKLDAKDRKYERERDKRIAQDGHKFNQKVIKTANQALTDAKKSEGSKKLAAGLATAIAGAIKGAQAQKKKDETIKPETPGMGGGTSRGMFTPATKEPETPVRKTDKSLDPSSRRLDSPKFLIPSNETLEQRVADLEDNVFSMTPKKTQQSIQKFQSGGFAGMVPNLGQPTEGDHFYTHVQPGSYILNRNAVAAMSGFQSGGTVPVALEQGEIAIPPGQYDQGTMDYLNYQAFPRFQKGGKLPVPTEPSDIKDSQRYLATTDALKRANNSFQDIQKFLKGGLVLFQGHGDVPAGQAQGTDGPGTEIEGKYKPNAEQFHVDKVATLASMMTPKIQYARPAGKFASGTDQGANWQRANALRSKGDAAIELHFDAYGREGGNFIKGNRGMLTGGRSLNKIEEAIRGAFGTHPASGSQSWGTLMLELDHVGKAPGNSQKYAEMLVKAVGGKGGNVQTAPGDEDAGGLGEVAQAPGATTPAPPTADRPTEAGTQTGPFGGMFSSIAGTWWGDALMAALGPLDSALQAGGGFSIAQLLNPSPLSIGGFSNFSDFIMGGGQAANAAEMPQQPGQQAPGQPGAPMQPGAPAATPGAPAPDLSSVPDPTPGARLSKDQVRKLAIQAGFSPTQANTIVGISGAESGRDPTNSTKRSGLMAATGEDSVGLMQINWGYHKNRGWLQKLGITSRAQLFDPALNMKAAKYLYDGRGNFGDWSVYNSGKYKSHLQKGGPVKKFKGGGIVSMTKRVGDTLQHFVEQNDMMNARMANADMMPEIIELNGGQNAEPASEVHTSGSNMPEFDLPVRDSCPLSIYYRYEPSFNPNGWGPG